MIFGGEGLMIKHKKGDIFTEDVEALVNTVNCVGVMGKGIALQFKNEFPDNFHAYAQACKRDEVYPGKMFLFETNKLTNPHYIINFPTKRHWRGGSRIEDIEQGLNDLVHIVEKRNIKSIAIPPLGSGLGGLDWRDVREKIESALSKLSDLQIVIYEPNEIAVSSAKKKNIEIPKMTEGRAVLLGLMNQFRNALLDPFPTLLDVHKLMYFMQEVGQSLQLRFVKGTYGPYAENMQHVLRAIEGHFISGYVGQRDAPSRELKLIPGAVNDAIEFLDKHPESKNHFERVVDLIKGFESEFGLELLSTVHWVIVKDTPDSHHELVAQVHSWNERKRRFTPRQIELAAEVLNNKGWTDSLR